MTFSPVPDLKINLVQEMVDSIIARTSVDKHENNTVLASILCRISTCDKDLSQNIYNPPNHTPSKLADIF